MPPNPKGINIRIACDSKTCEIIAYVISREKVPEGWASVIVFSPQPHNKVYLLCPDCLTRMVK